MLFNRLTALNFFLTLFFCGVTQLASATDNPLKFSALSTADGLSQSYVYGITQDREGFIWIATQDGLNRYDGVNFVHYRHSAADKNSLADNFVRKVYMDDRNTLWVGTNKGLSKYNAKFDNFDNYYAVERDSNTLIDNEIWEIYQDKAENIWVATELGLHKYNRVNDNFTQIQLADGFKEIKTLFQDKQNNYWLGTYDQGIYLANSKLSYAVSLKTPNKWNVTIAAKALYDIKEIDNHYWLATDAGIYVIDQDYQLRHHYQVSDKNQPILSNEVRSIELIDDKYVWVGTSNGLNIINLIDGAITGHQSDEQPKSLASNFIFSMYKASSGNLWLGTNGKGVNIYNPISAKFHHTLYNSGSEINNFAETSEGKIWLSSEQTGLNYLTKDDSVIQSKWNKENKILRMQPGLNNDLWLITVSRELYNFNTDTQQITKHTQWQDDARYNDDYSFVFIDHNIWFIDELGRLVQYDTIDEKLVFFQPNKNVVFKGFKNEGTEDLWLASSSNELYKFNIVRQGFKEVSFVKNNEFPINETSNITLSKNYIWLSSNSQGIALINRSNNDIVIFNENTGLSNNFVNSVIIDDDENAWCATNFGISVINPKTTKITNFTNDYSITDNEYLANSALKTSKNYFYVGGLNGFHHFDPQEILKIKQHIATPILTNLLIANQKVVIGKNVPDKLFAIEKSLDQLQTLTLRHAQSPFSIEFISPNAKFPHQTYYRYRLTGLETKWIESGLNNHRATYTNLSQGDYVFEVQAYDVHHPEQFSTKQLKIHILPPWWLSGAAILVYSALVLLIISYLIQQMRGKRLFNLQIQQSEERLKLALWGSGDEMWDWNIKTDKIYRSNIWGILDFPQDGERNSSPEQIASRQQHKPDDTTQEQTNIHKQDIARVRLALKQHFAQQLEHFEATYRVRSKNNQWLWILDRGKVVERAENGTPTRMTGTLKDISQIKKAEERLKLFAKCIENISDAVIIYDRQFNVVDINKAYQRITGKSKRQMLGTTLKFSQYPESYTQAVKKHLVTEGSWHGEIESLRGDQEKYSTDLNLDIIRDEDNNISHFVGVFSDITARKENEAELRKLANSDTLTNLPNRTYFQANQTRLVNNKTPHALLVFDLDNFKKINDSLGHEVGDVLLCKVAERIVNAGRSQDTVCRLGGDEFSLIIENTNDIHTITSIAKNILQQIAQPLKLTNHEVVLFSSIGIVLYPEDGASPQELLKNADTAMYHAKNLGGNKYQFFNDSMNKKAVKRLQVENLIRLGLKEDFFSVFYQPKIEIATGKIAGMEALVRFETPNKGIISPGVFIPVSEETGQIIDIGEVVLRKACFATKRWVDAGLFTGRIAVNLSAIQFTQPNLVELIASILRESKLPAKYLELEITEGTVMDSPQAAIDIMRQIRAMGIHLSLDDFGTGYSSLAYLKRFPLNTLKIDKAFVDDIEHSEQGRNMVATIITIAHNLDLQVVAEGVEHNFQLDFLAKLHCEQMQGFLYSKPLAEQDFKKYLIAQQVADKSTAFNRR